jgi:mono/diheme cytochrome c family protein
MPDFCKRVESGWLGVWTIASIRPTLTNTLSKMNTNSSQLKRHALPAALVATLATATVLASSIAPAAPESADAATVKYGEYLATIGGCHDCHTPMKMGAKGPEPDLSKALSGHPAAMQMPAPAAQSGPWIWQGAATNTAFAGPWGISYAANLTSHKPTGMGSWKAEDFIKAMRLGKHIGVGRPIMPPMPWQNYAQMSDKDLRALFAYLQSVPPMDNRVPDYQPPQSTQLVAK